MGWSLTLGSVAGIRIRMHFTFILFLVWVGLAFWQKGGADAAGRGLAYILLLFLCVVLHEFGHILTARHFGAETVDVVLLPIGGVARMKQIPEQPLQELAVAIAGPAVNIVIAVVLVAGIGPEKLTQQFELVGGKLPLLAQLAAANMFLAVFNLLPAFPMDGGRVLRALLALRLSRTRATAIATQIGHILAIGLGALGLLGGMPVLMLVALFVYFGASAENRDVQLRGQTEHLMARDVMITQFATLPVSRIIDDAVDLLVHSTQHDIPIVDGVGKAVGLLTRKEVMRALQIDGQNACVFDYMRSGFPAISETADLDQALQFMREGQWPAVAVTDRAGRIVGMVTLENLGQLLLLNSARRTR